MKEKYAVGADIGGSHITCALIDLEHQMILPETRVTLCVDNTESADKILGVWAEAISQSILGITIDELAGIGFAMPGPFDYVNGIALFERVEKFLNLYGVNVSEGIRSRLKLPARMPVRYMNDATAFAVGEAWIGVAEETAKSMAITLGTGFGSAFIDDGLPVVDREDTAPMGCVWHLKYKEGIADDYFSTRWFVNNYAKLTGETLPGVKEIADIARKDPKVAALFTEYGSGIGSFLGPWLNLFHAEVLVIGGNMAGAADLFLPAFEKALADLNCTTTIAWSELKENAALIGSARLLEPTYWQKMEPLVAKMN
ncbi:MAG: ROK family protein [Bacteroidales bacterium]|nr:ROK family protein [Bacteroidales bacterium]